MAPPRLRLVREQEPASSAEDAGRKGVARPVMPLDDSELIAAVREGDPGAAAAFHDRVRGRIDATLYRLLGGRDVDHDDLAQLSLIELVQTMDRFRGDCSLNSWVSTVTAHIVYKHIRRRKTERRIFAASEESENEAFRGPSSRRVVMARDLVARVRQHLSTIDPDKAWTFLLHDACGYDLREIAKITGVSVAAAQSRLVRARRDLHAQIAADPELADQLQQNASSRHHSNSQHSPPSQQSEQAADLRLRAGAAETSGTKENP
ncbi:RNA polymerase sigma factor [Pendulispora albinea]|uniref:RNA polymerase sigma factor n=1 Tax=Pendulispora albinea TaxID=2741071 RepID=A0ABZ2LUT4_9BACT